MDLLIIIIFAAMQALTPLLIAGLGELVCEKSGVLNLGIEGMMLVGCVTGFIVSVESGSVIVGFFVAAICGSLMAALFAFLVLILRTNQVASGLALTIFGIGLSSFIGLEYVGKPLAGLQAIAIPLLSDIPIIGKLLFSHDILVYLTFAMLIGVNYFLFRTRWGLILRAVGENHHSAHSMGYSVIRIRYLAIVFGGAMAGVGGAYLSLVYTPLWTENMTSGRGWIVLALVVFATWLPYRLLLGAFLFGLVSIVQLFLQGDGGWLRLIPTEFLSMLPYITTIIVLVLISSRKTRTTLSAPVCLGTPFNPR